VRTKDGLFGDYQIPMFLGIAAFFFAGMLTIVGGITFFTGVESPIGSMCLFGIVVLLIIGSVLLAIAFRLRRKQQHLEKVADLLKAYRRIRISKLAGKLGVNEMDAEYTIAECLGQGLVEGYIDRRSGEFFTKEALYQVMNLERCPICSAPSDELYLHGEEIRCKYCGTVGGVAIDRDGDGIQDPA
jgi:membrane protein implicated in regulation of membrane protease activity